jgi:SAM-dependent methyltransferase
MIRKGGRAPEIRRLMAAGKKAREERAWLEATLYADADWAINTFAPGKRVLDVGCGTGDLLAHLRTKGFSVLGVEVSTEAAARTQARGLPVYRGLFEDLVKEWVLGKKERFDAIMFVDILEHAPRPESLVKLGRKILNPGGIIFIRVPNDFSQIQSLAQGVLKVRKNWWVAAPDHINYFNFSSLKNFLKKLKFDVVHAQGDFPMEFFLLMGECYLGNQAVGSRCHNKRVRFERSLPDQLRRTLYERLSEIGLGRDCIVAARIR